jgi:putative restriction endonuclease
MRFSHDKINNIFSNLHVDKNKNSYTCGLAPHKPVLILSLLILEKNDRIDLNDITIDMYLRETWSELWECLKYPHPGPIYLPYYHMKSDGFWNIQFKKDAIRGQPKSLKQIVERVERVWIEPSVIKMFKDQSTWVQLVNTILNAGYFSKEEITCLTKRIKDIDESFVYQERLQKLVNDKFKETPDETYFGLPPSRNPAFRRMVLGAYNETCAVCNMKLENSLGISVMDAAHILPFSQFHNDDVRNGISLCKLHHWLFDHGLISIDEEYTVIVSEKIDYEWPEHIISRFQNKKMLLPEDEKQYPSPIALKWHQKNIFG